jgi:hypothetical protein
MHHHASADKSALQFMEQFLFVVVKFSMLLDSLTRL